MKLKWPQKIRKGGGRNIFLAGQNIYNWPDPHFCAGPEDPDGDLSPVGHHDSADGPDLTILAGKEKIYLPTLLS